MTLEIEDIRFAVDDARRRHEAVGKLVQEIDKQALTFLQLYLTLSAASLSGAGAILLVQSPTYPAALGFGLVAFGAMTLLAGAFCVATLWSADMNLPGRDPSFWLWADENGVTASHTYREYLKNLETKVQANSALNRRMSREMTVARILGLAAPAVGLLVALVTPLMRALQFGW